MPDAPAQDSLDPPREGPRPPREVWAVRVSVVLTLVLGLAYALIDRGVDEFCLDDAWIHLSYAKSLSLGDGLSYNPGDWETGFSSPLWVGTLAAWPTQPNPVIAVKMLGVLLHALCAGLAAMIALELARARASLERPLPLASIGLLAGVLVATQPSLLQGATSGMEVSLSAALLLACVYASLRDQQVLAGVFGLLAECSRPEAITFLIPFTLLIALDRRHWRHLSAGLGALAGLGLWVVYCLAVSGWPWPNTRYIKAAEPGLSGLNYLGERVLLDQTWLIGVGGLALIGAALVDDLRSRRSPPPRDEAKDAADAAPVRRRYELLALLLAWAAGLIATAISRPLELHNLFFQARYFAIFAAVPPIVIALGLPRLNRWLALASLTAVALATGLMIPQTHARQRAQELDVALLHRAPAVWVAEHLPKDAVIAVEGAGEHRWIADRQLEIVDVVGLNDATIAHAPDDLAKVCAILRHRPSHLVIPDQLRGPLAKVMQFKVLATFEDPANAQVEPKIPVRVAVLEIIGVRQDLVHCTRAD